MADSGHWQTPLVVASRLPFPERAAALRLRAQVIAAKLSAPHCGITSLAEVAARVATGRMNCGRRELAARRPAFDEAPSEFAE